MISGKNIIILLLILLAWACQPQGYSQKENIDWAYDILIEKEAKSQLKKYFALLEAESINIYAEQSSDDESEQEHLIVRIKQSLFFSKKPTLEKEEITERLAYLILSRLVYPYYYQQISLIYSEKEDLSDTIIFRSTYLIDQFELEIEEYMEEEA